MIIIGIFLIILSLFILVIVNMLGFLDKNIPNKTKNNGKYAILIPARDESKVIENLLISIENQTKKIDPNDVYIIVESLEDKTVDIVKKHKMNLVLRHDLTKKRKGYALDDAIKEILSAHKSYLAYFIFDADNILDEDFIKNMSKTIDKGYDIGIGYRNIKNSINIVSSASSLIFSLLNSLLNKSKLKHHNNMIISGTGFYIKGIILEKLGGFPFNSLTEDYELTLYSTLNSLTTYYNEEAVFYDEQPTDFKTSIVQRTRWVRGYIDARRKYINKILKSIKSYDKNLISKLIEIIGITPIIVMIIGLLLILVGVLTNYNLTSFILIVFSLIFAIYLILVVLTLILLIIEHNKLDLKVSKIKLLLYNPIFLMSFLYCFIKALFSTNLEWIKIPHVDNLKK